jgi:putative ABC transport system permease protein
MSASDIEWYRLALGYLILAVPLLLLSATGTNLVRTMILGSIRMTVQLLLVGYYLGIIFYWNNPWINILWLLVMILVAGGSITNRSDLPFKRLFLPVAASLLLAVGLVSFYMLALVLALPDPADARHVIPVSGMILGNVLNHNIIGLRTYYREISKQAEIYKYYLANGAGHIEALFSFRREAMRTAVSPSLATLSNVGLVSLPGMMTGQMLGGSDPMVAVKYQILIMLSIHSATVIGVYLAIRFSSWYAFDGMRMLRRDMYK